MTPDRSSCRWGDGFAYVVAPAMIGILLLIYLISPPFYLKYVIEEDLREMQAVEIVTQGAALLSALLLTIATVRVWRRDRYRGKIPNLPGGAILIAISALAMVFFAGEEISWGQTYFGGDTPELLQQTIGSRERNLHNSDLPISVQSLGSAYLLIMFAGLPIVWTLRHRLHNRWGLQLPEDWEPAIAEGPVVFAIVIAFAWKGVKDIYGAIQGDAARDSAFYMQFLEQINEHKEMLAAVAVLIYGIYRIRASALHTSA